MNEATEQFVAPSVGMDSEPEFPTCRGLSRHLLDKLRTLIPRPCEIPKSIQRERELSSGRNAAACSKTSS